MLEKPAIKDQDIISIIEAEYGLLITAINFLPLGADFNTAVYCATAFDGTSYFVKLRKEIFLDISVSVPKFLSENGVAEIICPLANKSGALSTRLQMYTLVIYPFISGKNGWEITLDETQWNTFGKALRQIHDIVLPSYLADCLPQENYSPHFRKKVREFQSIVDDRQFSDPSADALARILIEKKSTVNQIVQRAEDLAAILQRAEKKELVLCHSDIHMGNLLLSDDNKLYIVDWDQPIRAPKERDLMFIGGGIGGTKYTPEQEELSFYKGYGNTTIDTVALAYYRYERITQDIAEYCEQLLMSADGKEDRENSVHHFAQQFAPGNVVDMAYRAENKPTKK